MPPTVSLVTQIHSNFLCFSLSLSSSLLLCFSFDERICRKRRKERERCVCNWHIWQARVCLLSWVTASDPSFGHDWMVHELHLTTVKCGHNCLCFSLWRRNQWIHTHTRSLSLSFFHSLCSQGFNPLNPLSALFRVKGLHGHCKPPSVSGLTLVYGRLYWLI